MEEKRKRGGDLEDVPFDERRVPILARAEALLGRDPVSSNEFAEPLLDEHAEGCGDKTEDKRSGPEGNDQHRAWVRGERGRWRGYVGRVDKTGIDGKTAQLY